jgi:hypothetical protein
MASSRRVQVALAVGLALAVSTVACEQKNESTPTIGEPIDETAPVTSLVTITTTPVTIPLEYVEDCVEFVQFAAFVGIEDMVAMWDAAGHSEGRLRENCISLGRGDPDALHEISRRRDELEAFFGVTTTVAPAPGTPSARTTVPAG